MDADTREQWVRRFRDYLDTLDEDPDFGAPEEPDLFTLLAELAALKNEVKIESRQVKAALDQFGELFDGLRQANSLLDEELKRQRKQASSEVREAQRDLLLELVEVRDRLQAAEVQASGFRPGWLLRIGRLRDFISGMEDGLGMILRRFDEVLGRRGVRPLQTVDRPFDPHTMHATETVQRRDRAHGVVVSEIRAGFWQDDKLLRPAEVVVNKKDSNE